MIRNYYLSRSILFLVLFLTSHPVVCADTDGGFIRVKVDEISYVGDSNYQIEVILINESADNYHIKQFEERYYAQTEILGRWEPIESASIKDMTDYKNQFLGAKKKRNIIFQVKIPLDIPHLYLNAYGDVNVKFTYMLKFTDVKGANIFNNSGESFYWITPETNKWVLREGM